jgi:hypothetical protein
LRALALLAAAALVLPAAAQEKAPPSKKKPVARQQLAHRKATPDQIRRFNELEKKQEGGQEKRATGNKK